MFRRLLPKSEDITCIQLQYLATGCWHQSLNISYAIEHVTPFSPPHPRIMALILCFMETELSTTVLFSLIRHPDLAYCSRCGRDLPKNISEFSKTLMMQITFCKLLFSHVQHFVIYS